jgi:zinc transporter ZupT
VFEVALSLSIAGLLLGPVLTAWARGHRAALTTIDSAMLGVVLPLLLLRLIPHLIDEIGAMAIAAVAVGYTAFMAVAARAHARASRLGAAILLPVLAIHSFLDGTALAVAFERGVTSATGWTLGAALVLHRIPEGLVLASALIPAVGLGGTMLRVSLLAALTVVGALAGRELLAHAPDRALHGVVAVGILTARSRPPAGATASRSWPPPRCRPRFPVRGSCWRRASPTSCPRSRRSGRCSSPPRRGS